MQNAELDEILASLQQFVRQAYALGRSDALKQVVEVIKADPTSVRPLALLGPADEAASFVTAPPTGSVALPQDEASPPAKPSNDDYDATAAGVDATPWWARQPRTMW